ncbi:MAG: hypothetical protein WCE62_01395 [Polyangiales bacterium]
MRLITLSMVLALLLIGCGDSSSSDGGTGGTGGAGGTGGTGGGGTGEFVPTLSHKYEPHAVGVGEEISDLCQTWVLGNEEPLYVKKVRQTNDGAWHHSNWFFVPADFYPPKPGVEGPGAELKSTWRCSDRGFREYIAAAAGGVFFAQSTQAFQEIQAFPDGAALEIPPHSMIIGSVHLLNVSAAPIDSALTMDVETVPADEVEIRLTPFSFSNTRLSIPPQVDGVPTKSRFAMTCDLRATFQQHLGTDPNYNVYYVLAHYHEWGNYFNLSFAHEDGRRESILEIRNRVGEPIGRTIDPPMNNDGAMGLQVDCGYINNTDRTLHYGLKDQEMCVFLAYTDSNMKVGIGAGENHPMGEDEDGVLLNETDCGDIVAFRAYAD